MFKTKRQKAEVISLQIFERKCIGCEKCIDGCHHGVLGMIYKDHHSHATVEYRNRCVGCGRCAWNCPTDAIELVTA